MNTKKAKKLIEQHPILKRQLERVKQARKENQRTCSKETYERLLKEDKKFLDLCANIVERKK